MNKTRAVWTFIFNLICVIAALSSEVLADPSIAGLFPAKWAHAITMVSLAAMWVRSHRNLFFNPDNSPAWQPWSPPSLQDPPRQNPNQPSQK